MARIRTIKPEFWTSEQVADCSPTARLLFIGMWNFCDDYGIHPASTKRLKMEVFPADNLTQSQIESLVEELIEAGLLREYTAENEEYWAVTGWKHQKIEKPLAKYPKPNFDNQSPTIRRSIADPSPPEGKGMDVDGNGMDMNASPTRPANPENQIIPLKAKRNLKKTRLEKWEIEEGDEHVAYARECGMTLAEVAIECEKFENYHKAHGSLMSDWAAAWKTWCRNWQKFRKVG